MLVYRIFEYTSYVLDFYLLILSLRIILSWFGGASNSSSMHYLRRITDPYLDFFRKTGILRFGFLDFSALLGIFLLLFLSRLFKYFGIGTISLAVAVEVLVQTVINGLISILSVFVIVVIIRFITFFIRKDSIETFSQHLDGFLHPLIMRFARSILPHTIISYKAALAGFLFTCVLAVFLVQVLLFLLIPLIRLIPI